MLRVDNLKVNFKEFSLNSISFEIKRGKNHLILGPSGAGKSTIISTILGLRKVDSGKIYFEGADITNMEVNKRGFGYVPQNLALFPHLSVEQNIYFGLKATKKEPNKIVKKLIDIAGIKELLHRYPDTLSGGQKQRVAIVRAVATLPKLLLLDEPFSALDITLKRELWELLNELKESFDITTLMITHDLDEAFFLADSVSIVIDGKIVQSGTKEEIFYKPASIEVAKYLGFKNIFSAKAISGSELAVDELNCILTTQTKLKKDISYNIVIREQDIVATNKRDINTLEGSAKVLSYQYYNIAEFKVANSNATLEFVVDKNFEESKYILLPKNSILCYKK